MNNYKLIKEMIKNYPFEFLWDIYEQVEKETREKVGEKYPTWSEHYNNWIDIVQPIIKELPPLNSLLIFRFMEFNKNLLWIQTCVLCGQYYSAIRELRYALESVLKAYYLDEKYPKEKVEFKVKKDGQLIGRKLIGELDLSDDHKTKLKDLYGELCKYVHPTKEEFEAALAGEIDIYMTSSFNQILFDRCVEFTNKVVDAIFFVVLHKFRSIAPKIKANKLMVTSLKEHKCELSLEYL